MQEENNNRLLSAKEVSKYLCVPFKSIYYLTQTGKIKGIKIGKHWKYHIKDIKNYYYNGTSRESISFERRENTEYISERRALPRLNCNISCSYRILIPAIKDITSSGNIRNISGNGILLSTAGDVLSNIDIGDPVELEFKLDLENNEIKTDGRIVRKAVDGFGIKFRNISRDCQDLIIQFVG